MTRSVNQETQLACEDSHTWPRPHPTRPLGILRAFCYNLGLTSNSLGSALSHTYLAFFIQQSSFVLPPVQPHPITHTLHTHMPYTHKTHTYMPHTHIPLIHMPHTHTIQSCLVIRTSLLQESKSLAAALQNLARLHKKPLCCKQSFDPCI